MFELSAQGPSQNSTLGAAPIPTTARLHSSVAPDLGGILVFLSAWAGQEAEILIGGLRHNQRITPLLQQPWAASFRVTPDTVPLSPTNSATWSPCADSGFDAYAGLLQVTIPRASCCLGNRHDQLVSAGTCKISGHRHRACYLERDTSSYCKHRKSLVRKLSPSDCQEFSSIDS